MKKENTNTKRSFRSHVFEFLGVSVTVLISIFILFDLSYDCTLFNRVIDQYDYYEKMDLLQGTVYEYDFETNFAITENKTSNDKRIASVTVTNEYASDLDNVDMCFKIDGVYYVVSGSDISVKSSDQISTETENSLTEASLTTWESVKMLDDIISSQYNCDGTLKMMKTNYYSILVQTYAGASSYFDDAWNISTFYNYEGSLKINYVTFAFTLLFILVVSVTVYYIALYLNDAKDIMVELYRRITKTTGKTLDNAIKPIKELNADIQAAKAASEDFKKETKVPAKRGRKPKQKVEESESKVDITDAELDHILMGRNNFVVSNNVTENDSQPKSLEELIKDVE